MHTISSSCKQKNAKTMLFPTVPLFIYLATIASRAVVLPSDEVNALREIGSTLGKNDWDFSVDPCSGLNNWNTRINSASKYMNSVTCNCSFLDNTVCHVDSISLRAQNLAGTLPPTLAKLRFLKVIDLSWNYLNGTIPIEWGSMQLVNIFLYGNRVAGPIPKELGNISTLVNVDLGANELSGVIPPEIGSLASLENITLWSNNLTGELPEELAKLTSLKYFRISGNPFNGTIPSFIQNWTNLERLSIQGTGFNGPIPSSIASLTKLTILRISDLIGNATSFPPISGAKNLTHLLLRNCNITGPLPDYLSSMTELNLLDLSFNKLTGSIPKNFSKISGITFMYLSGNFLSGEVPDWALNSRKVVDLSYNNFSGNAAADICQRGQTNLFKSSSQGNTSAIGSCSTCSRRYNYLRINCGGRRLTLDDGTIYEEDMEPGGPSNFVRSSSNRWSLSSTGNFFGHNPDNDPYISTKSGSSMDLYQNARLSPLSLTYYGFCLENGKYTVNLHFAEIMFTDDSSYASLGRRIFDIYIQGKLVKKDFNIKDEAGGVDKPIVKSFTAMVNDNTLDIRFFWAGKGTANIPDSGVYGPLISAISVDSASKPNSLSPGAIVGIVIGVLSAISSVLVSIWWRGCFRAKDTLENDLKGLDLQTGSFTLRQLKAATNNFDPANKIGEGGFGPVYKGDLRDGTMIAVKKLSAKSSQGNREFVNEIGMISALKHPNLVKLYGCCVEGNQLLLVYEYMENNSLARALFEAEELDWPTRHKICVGVARGLAFLHEESRLKIVHRDIKATNVLLDKELNAKISDFGLAKLKEDENTHISTRIAGTLGYMAPEYAMRGYLTDKADVYSFGVVLLEIVSGRSNTSIKPKHECFYILDWANDLKEQGKLTDIVDPRLGSNCDEEEVMRTLHIALLCTNASSTDRPSMSAVVSMLEGREEVETKLILETSGASSKMEDKPLEIKEYEELLADSEVSMEMPFIDSSTSGGDLYPVNVDSEYLEKRAKNVHYTL